MKIGVLGATGPSGQQVVQEALERGHEVKAIVRNPDKLQITDEKLEVIKADIYNAEELSVHLSGCDAVLSCLGCPPSYFSLYTITFYTDTMPHIVAAMRTAGVKRLIVMSAWYSQYDASHPFIINWVLKPMFLGQSLKNMGEMEQYLEKECSDIDYTAVRCPQMVNKPKSGKELRVEEGVQFIPGGLRLTNRRDVAIFMLDCAENGSWIRKCVAVTV